MPLDERKSVFSTSWTIYTVLLEHDLGFKKLTVSVVLLSYFFPSSDLLCKSSILRKSKLKDSESNPF